MTTVLAMSAGEATVATTANSGKQRQRSQPSEFRFPNSKDCQQHYDQHESNFNDTDIHFISPVVETET